LRAAVGEAAEIIWADADLTTRLARGLTSLWLAARGGPLRFAHASPPEHLPEALRPMLPLVTLLAATPLTRALHAAAGLYESITHDTLDDLERWAVTYHRRHGRWGVAELPWLHFAVAGGLLRLGRLQFEPVLCRWPLPGVAAGTPLLNVHIPRMGPMDPGSCDASFEQAPGFFARHFPHLPFAGFVCESWLLDPRWAEVLPAESNIVRFQKRFQLAPEAGYENLHMVEHAFDHDRISDPERRAAYTPTPQTTLQRAVADHRAAGGQWRSEVGWFPMP
jgi:hypothetical protein